MASVDVRWHSGRVTGTGQDSDGGAAGELNWTPRAIHVLFTIVWSLLLASACFFLVLGAISSAQTFDSGPVTHEAQAGIDFLVSGILAATGVVVIMTHAAARLVELTVLRQRGA